MNTRSMSSAALMLLVLLFGNSSIAWSATNNWSGDIPDGTVWSAGDVQVLTADTRIPAGSTLTIEPGAVVKFQYYSVDLFVEGTVNALGTAAQNIVFTTLVDDGAGGDTNGDGGASTPYRGAWGRIEFKPGSSGSLAHADIRYGGWNTRAALILSSSSVVVTDTSVRESTSNGVGIVAADPTLTDNTYRDNDNSAISMDLGSNPAIRGVTVINNGINGLTLDSGALAKSGAWNDPDIVYTIPGDITVPAGMTLTLAPGQVIKFHNLDDGLFIDGTMNGDGDPSNPIVFTDFRDDSAGGDTNNNADANAPRWDGWERVQFRTGGSGTLDYVEFRYGGWNSSGQLIIDGAIVSFTNGVVRDSGDSGVRIQNSNPTLTGNAYRDNAGAAISMDLGSNPVISGVTLDNNGINGLRLDAGNLTKNGAWDDPDIVYTIPGDITVPAGMTLTLAPGQMIKFHNLDDGLFIDGTMNGDGEASSPIVFTDLRDDSAGGDTNNNADGNAPRWDGWERVQFRTGGSGALDYVEFRYGGWNSSGQLIIDGATVSFTNGVVRDSGDNGVRVQNSAPVLTGNAYRDNAGAAISMDLGSNPAISGVTLDNNGVNGLRLDSGHLTRNGFWNDPDIVYTVSGDITVPDGITLVVAAGQVIKFHNSDHGLFVDGSLDAAGTVAEPIVFTELRDDSAGGDTNNDADASLPARDRWERVELREGSTATLEYVEFRYGGWNSSAEFTIVGADASLSHGTVSHSSSNGISIQNSDPILTNNSYHDNAWSAIRMDLGSNPAISGVAVTNNGTNGLTLDAGNLTKSGFWDDPDIVYTISGDIGVPAGMTLTLAPGQVIKFHRFNYGLFIDGGVNAEGTLASPIVFTEIRDDSAGGDTNNDADVSSPSDDNWQRVHFQPGASGVLDYVEFRYGGWDSRGELVIDGADVSFTNGVVRDSNDNGVRIQNSNPTLTNNSYRDNAGAAISMDLGSNPAISRVAVINNGVNGLRLDGGVLSRNGLWNDPDIVYTVSNDISVPSGMTLGIAGGQVVKFQDYTDGLFVEGGLDAVGGPSNPVVFTEIRDDSAGGDTNNDGNASIPARDQWETIEYKPGSRGVLNHVDMRYGGWNSSAELEINRAEVTLANGIIRDSSSNGVYINDSAPILTDNSYHDNAAAAIYMDPGSNPAIEGVTVANNAINGIRLGGGTLTANAFWDDPDIVYTLHDDVTVPVGVTLTLAPGQVVKFERYNFGLFVNGALEAYGAPTNPIIFTSINDDAAGGDTNNDADATSPGWDSWERISFGAGARGTLDYTAIRYGGWNSAAMLTVDAAELALTNSRVDHSYNAGIWSGNQAQVTLLSNRVYGNRGRGVTLASNTRAIVTNNTVNGNAVGLEISDAKASVTNNLVTNNSSSGILLSGWPYSNFSFNDVFNPQAANFSGLPDPTGSDGNLSADPLYVDPDSGDFSLQDGSPAIDAADSEPAPVNDALFNWRHDHPATPNTGDGPVAYYDIGAIEFGGPPRQIIHQPAGLTAGPVDTLTLIFRGEMDTDSFLPAEDVAAFTGPGGSLPVIDFEWINHYRLAIRFNPRFEVGDYEMLLQPTILDSDGLPLDLDGDLVRGEIPDDRYSAAFTIYPPRITGNTPHGVVTGSVDALQLLFDRPMDQGSFSLADDIVSFTGPDGDLQVLEYSWIDQQTLALSFAPQTALGNYHLVVGADILDLGGNPLDQDQDRLAGETGDDQYRASFTLVDLIHVSGSITEDSSWHGTVVVDDQVSIATGTTITLAPGTVVKVDPAQRTGITVPTGAVLNIQGTVAEPVTFTSLRDDSVGGDTNQDGGDSFPAHGDWSGIHVSGGHASIDHAVLRYGGGTSDGNWTNWAGALVVQHGGTVTLTNSIIQDSFYEGIIAWGSGTVDASNCIISGSDRGVNADGGTTINLTNCTIDDNRVGIYGHNGDLNIANTIISNSLDQGIYNILNSPIDLRYSNVWSAIGVNYRGTSDRTGTDGNLSIDPEYRDRDSGSYQLGFRSPMIDAADGILAPASDLLSTPRFDDPRSENTGIATPSGEFADIGALEFAENATSNIDLLVTGVTPPVEGIEGQQVDVSWSVTNQGSEIARGSWHDRVYLSADPVWSPDDQLLGEGLHSGDIGPGQVYDGRTEVILPGVVPGDYWFIVRANGAHELFEGINLANNAGAAAETTAITLPTLSLDTPQQGQLSGPGAERHYRLLVPGNEGLKVTLDGPDGSVTELYVKAGELASRQSFDGSGVRPGEADQTVSIASTRAGEYFVTVIATEAPQPGNFTILATLSDFSIASVNPDLGGNTGQVTLTVDGAQFDTDTTVRLINSAGTPVEPISMHLIDSGRVSASFDLTGQPVGVADLQVIDGGGAVATLVAGFEIIEGRPGALNTSITLPSRVRVGRVYPIYIEYQNTGYTDLLAPTMRLSTSRPSITELSLCDCMSNPASELYLIGANPSGAAGILPPGGSGRIKVYGRALARGAHQLQVDIGSYLETIDWVALEPTLRPPAMSDQEWEPLFQQLKNRIGDSWSGYVQALSDAATLLPPAKGVATSLQDVFGLETEMALADLDTTVSGQLFADDAQHPLSNAHITLFDEQSGIASSAYALTDGSFRMAGVQDGDYRLAVDGYVLPAALTVNVSGANVSLQDIVVGLGGSISGGVVFSPGGIGLAGVTVYAQAEQQQDSSSPAELVTAQTNSDGSYLLGPMVPGIYTVVATDGVHPRAWVSGIVVAAGASVANINLITSEAASIRGTVRGPDGAPLADARVTAAIADEPYNESGALFLSGATAITAADGSYLLQPLPAAEFTLTASKSGLSAAELPAVSVTSGDALSGQDLQLGQAGSVSGIVTSTATGAAAPFMFVMLARDGVTKAFDQTTDAGEFLINDLPPGDYQYVTSAHGFQKVTGTVTIAINQTTALNLSLPSAGQVSGRVLTPSGDAVAGVGVEVRQDGQTRAFNASDEQGNYALVDLPYGDYQLVLTVTSGGAPLRQYSLSLAPGTVELQQDFTLALAGTLSGRVTAADGSPRDDARVLLLQGSETLATVRTNADGGYSFPILQPGSYSVLAKGSSYARRDNLVVNGGNAIDAIDFDPGTGSVAGTVLDSSTGQPLENAVVFLAHPGLEDFNDSLPTAASGPDGSYRIDKLAPGDYDIMVQANGSATQVSTISVPPSGSPPVDFSPALDPGAVLQGTVETPDGSPKGGAQVTAYRKSDGLSLGTVYSGEDGSYSVAGLDPDTEYRIVAIDGDNGTQRVESHTPAADGLELDLGTLPSTTSVGGTVSSDGSPVDGATITFSDDQGATLEVLETGPDGKFATVTLPPDSIKMTTRLPGHAPVTQNLSLSSGETLELPGVALTSVAASGEHPTVEVVSPGTGPQDNDGRWASPHTKIIPPDVYDPPLPQPKIGCEGDYDRAARLRSVREDLSTAVVMAHSANSNTAAAADVGIAGAKAFDIVQDVMGLLNPVQGAMNAATDQLVAAHNAANLADSVGNPLKTAANIKALLANFIPAFKGAFFDTASIAEKLQKPQQNYRWYWEFQQDVTKVLGLARNLLKTATFFRDQVKQLPYLKDMPVLDKVLTVINIVNNSVQLVIEVGNAYSGITGRQQAYDNADFTRGVASREERIARSLLELCNERNRDVQGPVLPPGMVPPGSTAGSSSGQSNETSSDPNDKVAPGVGSAGFIQPGVIPYIIQFENDPDLGATLPAQEVFVTDRLHDDVDLATLAFTGFGFDNREYTVPAGLSHYQTIVDLRPEGIDLLVEVILDLNVATRTLSVSLRSLDPLTGDLPEDIDAGFLPVNDKALHNGEGYVSYIVSTAQALASGSEITNQAAIVFDLNEAILTPTALNTIDTESPVSAVTPLPATSPPSFQVSWSGNDGQGSGPASYNIYVQEDAGSFQLWLADSTDTSATYTGSVGHDYGFYSVAIDQVGNRESSPAGPDTVTTIAETAPVTLHRGFNLIAVPSDGSADLAAFIAVIDPSGSFLESAIHLNRDSGRVEQAFIQAGGAVIDNFPITAGEALVLIVSSDRNITFTRSSCPEFDLQPGPNWVGTPCAFSEPTAFEYLQAHSDTVLAIQRFNPESGRMETAMLKTGQAVGTDFPLSAGIGYIVFQP